MPKVVSGKIVEGKILVDEKLSKLKGEFDVKIFIFSHPKNQSKYFGKLKNTFGDGLAFQKKLRKEWK